MKPAGVILAGGLARRMGGGDKVLQTLGGRALLSHVVDALSPHTSALAISANGDAARFSQWNLPVLADSIPDHPGPLAGILTGLRWAAQVKAPALVTTAGDTPFLPTDLVERLGNVFAETQADVVMAERAGILQPVVAVWSLDLADDLETVLTTTDLRSVEAFAKRRRWAVATFDDSPHNPFFNINTPEDLAAAHLMGPS